MCVLMRISEVPTEAGIGHLAPLPPRTRQVRPQRGLGQCRQGSAELRLGGGVARATRYRGRLERYPWAG
jgi:hypothetical protein